MEQFPTPEKIKIRVREAGGTDAEQIQRVYYQAWLATYPSEQYGITREDIEASFKARMSVDTVEKRRQAIETLDPDWILLVAENEGAIVAVCRARRSGNERRLQSLYVLPEYQGKGIGKKLWERVAEFLGTDKDVFVDVVEYNDRAINFYSKLGFVDTGKRFTEERHRLPSGKILPEMEMVLRAKYEQ